MTRRKEDAAEVLKDVAEMEKGPMLHSASMRSVPWRVWVLALCSALLQALPFPLAGPVPLWRRMFCWVCLAPLLAALLDDGRLPGFTDGRKGTERPLGGRGGFWVGYLCGVVWYLLNCYWIYPTMHLYGGIPPLASAGILVLFALYLGLYHGLFGALVAWLAGRLGRGWALGLAPVAWVAVEMARGRVTGFPWDLLGYTQVENGLLTRMAPWTGVIGLSLVVAAVNALWLVRGRGRFGRVAAGLALFLAVAFTVLGAPEQRHVAMGLPQAVLLQDNLAVGREGVAGQETAGGVVPESRAQMLGSFTAVTEQAGRGPGARGPEARGPEAQAMGASGVPAATELVLWPEAPADFFDADPGFRQAVGQVATTLHAPVIADSVAVDRAVPAGERPRVYNSASFFAADGSYSGRYDKMHLVPFGEYTPYKQLFFFAGHLLDNVGTFTPGQQRTVFRTGGHAYGVFICYESIFGDEVRELARSGAEVLVNLSDDGWYGDSSAPWEHLDMARMRAIENRRWVLRSTNTGVTAAIDPDGRIVAELPRHERAALRAPFAYAGELTFYTRFGDWVGWLCVLATAAAMAAGWRRRAVEASAAADAVH